MAQDLEQAGSAPNRLAGYSLEQYGLVLVTTSSQSQERRSPKLFFSLNWLRVSV